MAGSLLSAVLVLVVLVDLSMGDLIKKLGRVLVWALGMVELVCVKVSSSFDGSLLHRDKPGTIIKDFNRVPHVQ